MIRLAGINISKNKQILISLTYIFGIGKSTSKKICDELNINYFKKICDLEPDIINNIKKKILNYNIEGDLKKEISINIKRLIDINCYRGIRHKKNLPTRGQRTKTNAKTRKKCKKYIKK